MTVARTSASRSRLSWILPLAIGAAVGASVMYVALKPVHPRHGITPVEAGVMYRSGQLEADELERAIGELGIRTVVNLGSKHDWDEPVCRAQGVKYVDLPVGDVWAMCGVPAPNQTAGGEPYDLRPLWELLESPEAQPILIHCWGGVHRTGVASAIYRIRHDGWRAEEAIREMDLYGFDSHKSKFEGVRAYLNDLATQLADARPGAKTPDALANDENAAPSYSPLNHEGTETTATATAPRMDASTR